MDFFRALTIAVLVLTTMCACQSLENASSNPVKKCDRINHKMYQNLNIKDVLGKWVVDELHLHNMTKGGTFLDSYKNRNFTNMIAECPTVTILDKENSPATAIGHLLVEKTLNDTRLTLLWNESGAIINYEISSESDISPGGLWSLRNVKSYADVRVVNASRNYLVLNFCNTMDNVLMYTTLLSRKPLWNVKPSEVVAVHSFLENMKLKSKYVTIICPSSATKAFFSLSSVIVIFLQL